MDNQLIMFKTSDGRVSIEVLFENDNVWISQKKIAELYETAVQNVIIHLKNIYADGELLHEATCKKSLQVQMEGNRKVNRNINLYSLEAILAVGYRVNSQRGIQFRQWAIGILHKYVFKGFAVDSDRFKYGSKFSSRFFDELLEEIRDIRASERAAYQKITDIYATSVDYSKDTKATKTFYAAVQNKLHFAITGFTAAEIIAKRADSNKPHMRLTSWRRSPKGKIMPSDVKIAKNYLEEPELKHLNHIVSMYLDYAELQAARHIPMTMADWTKKLDAFP